MKNRRFFLLLSFLANMLVFVMAAQAVTMSFLYHESSALSASGFSTFRYFTTDSNVLAGLVSLIGGIAGLLALLKGKDRLPRFVILLKYVGTSAVMVTFMVVLLFLGLIFGYGSMYTGTSFYMHGIVPILCLVSFAAFDRGYRLKKKEILLSLIPVVVYGIVYFIMVVALGPAKGGWRDFYAFNAGGRWYLSMPIVFSGAAGLAALIRLLHNACDRTEKE